VVAITGGGPRGLSVEFVVRDGDFTRLGVAGDNHLTADVRELGMLMIIRSRNSKVEGYYLAVIDPVVSGHLVRQNSANLVVMNEWVKPYQTISEPARVIASPPQMYLGFNSYKRIGYYFNRLRMVLYSLR